MVKNFLVPLVIMISLMACSLGESPGDSEAEQSASMTRVAEAVSATGTAMAANDAVEPEATPTPEKKPLDEAILNAGSLNVTLGIWPPAPHETTVPSSNPLCLKTCFEELWISIDGRATLRIGLFEFANRDQVVTELRDIKASQTILGVKEVPIPDYASMPTDSWMQDNGTSGSRYTLHSRQGRVLVVMTIYLPDYDEAQNLLFLSLYGSKQIEMLAEAGW